MSMLISRWLHAKLLTYLAAALCVLGVGMATLFVGLPTTRPLLTHLGSTTTARSAALRGRTLQQRETVGGGFGGSVSEAVMLGKNNVMRDYIEAKGIECAAWACNPYCHYKDKCWWCSCGGCSFCRADVSEIRARRGNTTLCPGRKSRCGPLPPPPPSPPEPSPPPPYSSPQHTVHHHHHTSKPSNKTSTKHHTHQSGEAPKRAASL